VRICFVVQRYGADLHAGAERHCRGLARRLAGRHDVQVATTCALDYGDWRNHYPAGRQSVEGIPVTRFPVARPRDRRRFALYSDIVFRDHHTPAEEAEWVRQNGPYAPGLVEALPSLPDVDLFVFYSYRYYTTCFGLPGVRERSVLVPTAEDDAAVGLGVFHDLFRAPRGILYLTPEERDLVQGASGNQEVPSAVIGSGLEVPGGWESVEVGSRFGLERPYLLYLGRIDGAKGVDRLCDDYLRLQAEWPECPTLALAGTPQIPVPQHPRIRCLGPVSEEEKYALLAGCAVFLLPSALESLSIAVLEAWAMGRPALVNARCRVLEGQCVRSNGGLFYHGYAEFAPALRLLVERPELAAEIGDCGREYARTECRWEAVEERALGLLERVARPATGRSGP
jgi:glycosyltransferase involved in cell wall biosynthesis